MARHRHRHATLNGRRARATHPDPSSTMERPHRTIPRALTSTNRRGRVGFLPPIMANAQASAPFFPLSRIFMRVWRHGDAA